MSWEEGTDRKAASPPPRISHRQEGKTREEARILLGEGAQGARGSPCDCPAVHASIYCFTNPSLECLKERGTPRGAEGRGAWGGRPSAGCSEDAPGGSEQPRSAPSLPDEDAPGAGRLPGECWSPVPRGGERPDPSFYTSFLFIWEFIALLARRVGAAAPGGRRGCAGRGRDVELPARAVLEG